MRAEISLLHKEIGVTTIYVTHDQVEAMTLGQRGRDAEGRAPAGFVPQELYARPANLRGRSSAARDELLRGSTGAGRRNARRHVRRRPAPRRRRRRTELAGGLDARRRLRRRRRAPRAPRGRGAGRVHARRPAPDGPRPAARAPRLGARRPLRGRGRSRRHRGDARPRGGRRRVDADRARPPEIGTRTSFVGRFAARRRPRRMRSPRSPSPRPRCASSTGNGPPSRRLTITVEGLASARQWGLVRGSTAVRT